MSVRREVLLNDKRVQLLGACPQVGQLLPFAEFSIPPARNASRPLVYSDLVTGPVLVSTLPNIAKHACAAQIFGLEEAMHKHAIGARLIHVSADEPHYWSEVDLYHANLTAEGYSLANASPPSVRAFTRLFGVAGGSQPAYRAWVIRVVRWCGSGRGHTRSADGRTFHRAFLVASHATRTTARHTKMCKHVRTLGRYGTALPRIGRLILSAVLSGPQSIAGRSSVNFGYGTP